MVLLSGSGRHGRPAGQAIGLATAEMTAILNRNLAVTSAVLAWSYTGQAGWALVAAAGIAVVLLAAPLPGGEGLTRVTRLPQGLWAAGLGGLHREDFPGAARVQPSYLSDQPERGLARYG